MEDEHTFRYFCIVEYTITRIAKRQSEMKLVLYQKGGNLDFESLPLVKMKH